MVAIGNPLGVDGTVTAASSRRIERRSSPDGVAIDDAIQTDAAINPGNSGGPLVNANGKVVGITSQIADQSDLERHIGIGFAIPIDTAKQLGQSDHRHGKAQHPCIGVRASP